jgi:hypothetical protein
VDIVKIDKLGRKTPIPKETVKEVHKFIREYAIARKFLPYSELEDLLKAKGYRKINRFTIGNIVGEVSDRISASTVPLSIYPSAIVVHKWTEDTGKGFWTLERGSDPPYRTKADLKKKKLKQYQKNVFEKKW